MSRDGGALRVVLPVQAGKYRLLLDIVWLCVWLAAEAVLVAAFAGPRFLPGPRSLLIAPLVLFSAAGVFLAYRWLWYWGGRERFVLEPGRLLAAREIFGIGRTRAFPRDRIRDIHARRLLYRLVYPSWGRMFLGNGDGEIVIEGDAGPCVYAKGLSLEEAEHLAELLRSELRGSPDRKRRPTEFQVR
jgi:hypothetical protein